MGVGTGCCVYACVCVRCGCRCRCTCMCGYVAMVVRWWWLCDVVMVVVRWRDGGGYYVMMCVHKCCTHCRFRKKLSSAIRKHLSAMQKMWHFSGVSAEHTGSKLDKDICEIDLDSEPVWTVDYSAWTLILLDVNGTLLYRKWLGYKQGYGPCTLRPLVHEFFSALSKETRTVIGIWTGATTMKKMRELLQILARAGIKKNDLFCSIPALPGCKSRKCFPGTTKPIWLKPISVLVDQVLPKFKQAAPPPHTHTPKHSPVPTLTITLTDMYVCLQILLLDDDEEKMLGIYNSSTKKTRLANDPDEYVIVSHFRGDPQDDKLRIGGRVWCELTTKIRQANNEPLDDLKPRSRRLVPIPPKKPPKKLKSKNKSSGNVKSKSKSKAGRVKAKRPRGRPPRSKSKSGSGKAKRPRQRPPRSKSKSGRGKTKRPRQTPPRSKSNHFTNHPTNHPTHHPPHHASQWQHQRLII